MGIGKIHMGLLIGIFLTKRQRNYCGNGRCLMQKERIKRQREAVKGRILRCPSIFPLPGPGIHTLYNPQVHEYNGILLPWLWFVIW